MLEVDLPRLVARWQTVEKAFRAVHGLDERPLVCWLQLLGAEPSHGTSVEAVLAAVRSILASVPAAERDSWHRSVEALGGVMGNLEKELNAFLDESNRVRAEGMALGSPEHRRYEVAHDRIDYLLQELAQDICATARAVLAAGRAAPARVQVARQDQSTRGKRGWV